jgi:hypothetical protein
MNKVFSVEAFNDEFEVWDTLVYTDSFDTARLFVRKFITELYKLDERAAYCEIKINRIVIYENIDKIMRDSPNILLNTSMHYKCHYNGDTHKWEGEGPIEILEEMGGSEDGRSEEV